MRTTVQLPDALLKAAKQRAAQDGRTLTSLIEEGLQHVLFDRPQAAKGKRRLPRVSKAKGGLRPGIDPTKINTEVQDVDDLDMLERAGLTSGCSG